MNSKMMQKLRRRKRRIARRLANRRGPERERPMLDADTIHYELADRSRGLAAGGIGAMLLLARRTGSVADIDRRLHLLKRHLPYHESDHVLNIAFNILAGGRRLEHLELRRNDEVYLDALGAERIPDPTTAGDSCRRFGTGDVLDLMDAVDDARPRVWEQQPAASFREAIIDADGTLVATDGACKQGVDPAYDGTWGYHPPVVSLAHTAAPLYPVNRPGDRPSHEMAASFLDRAIRLCRAGGFRSLLLRGDTDSTRTAHLDRRDGAGDIRFLFGMDARPDLIERAERLPEAAYGYLERPVPPIETVPRGRRERHKARVVRERGSEAIHALEEMVGEFAYRPTACEREYRVVVLRKRLAREKGQLRLFEEYRYSFFITNDGAMPADQVVLSADGRCDQEDLISQLKTGVYALEAPVDDLVSNGAYMVMAALAWSLKAWAALLVPESPRHAEAHRAEERELLRMGFRTSCAAMIELPCQIVRGSRRSVYRLLSWDRWNGAFLRLVERLHGGRLC